MTPVVYISGTGRSGTNILKDILSLHSDVASLPFEHRFTIDPDGLFDFYQGIEYWSPYTCDKKLKRLETFLLSLAERDDAQVQESETLKREGKTGYPYAAWELDKWIPNYSTYVKELIKEIYSFTYEASYPGSDSHVENNEMYFIPSDKTRVSMAISLFLDRCHNSIIKSQRKKIFVEDNTWSILFADILMKITPQGKLIHIIRDPRDVIASYCNQRWTPSKLSDVVMYYKDIMTRWIHVKKSLVDKSYMEVSFENLIQHKEEALQKICSFMQIPFEASLMEMDTSRANIGRHKEQFTKEEIDYIEEEIADILSIYNYSKVTI